MKIAFDASDLCTDEAVGTTRYTWELAKRVPLVAPQHSWEFHAPCGVPKSYPAFAEGYGGQSKLSVKNSVWHSSPWPKYWTQSRFSLELFKNRPDVLFMPIQQLPIIRPPRLKTVAVIHDLAFHVYPQETAYKDWLLLHIFTAQVAREADHIIAISQATADDIGHFYGRTNNVHVVHHGIDHAEFYEPTAEEKNAGWEKLQTAYPQLKQPYLLYVGQIQPRKNLIRVTQAFEQLADKDSDMQFVISSGKGWLQAPILERIKASRHAARIHLLGRVPNELLPALYWHAEVFVLASLYEGFGIPVIEAMACGTPVVTSNVSCLPEVAGNAAVLVDPFSPESIAAGIQQARSKRSEFVAQGLAHAKKFTTEATVQKVAKIITS